jgi:hypothetical protein
MKIGHANRRTTPGGMEAPAGVEPALRDMTTPNRHAAVAIRTPHVALRNFGQHLLDAKAARHHQADRHELAATNVIEVEHDGIGLAAVHAWVRPKVIEF